MNDYAQITPEDRVLLKVGGSFTPDTYGPEAYESINSTIRENPDAHLEAFEQLFLNPRPSRQELTELFLPDFLQYLSDLRPDRVRAMAQRLSGLMGSLARHQANEAENLSESSDEAFDEMARQRRQLARRRNGLGGLVGPR